MKPLVDRLMGMRFLTYGNGKRAKANIGIFMVVGKDEYLRLVFGCRPTNAFCKPPQYTILQLPAPLRTWICEMSIHAEMPLTHVSLCRFRLAWSRLPWKCPSRASTSPMASL
eukprot:6208424-Heterocapsa_arctica.AAC.1